jgi:hypothetical protein
MIELNGLANLKILLDELTDNLPNDDRVTVPAAKMYEQLELLNRYMVAYARWTAKEIEEHNSEYDHVTKTNPPRWHEVRMNPNRYPTNHEELDGLKQEKSKKV